MRARAHEETIEIDAEDSVVFDLIHDDGRRLEWDPFLKEASLLDAGEAGVGVTCLFVARNVFGGQRSARPGIVCGDSPAGPAR